MSAKSADWKNENKKCTQIAPNNGEKNRFYLWHDCCLRNITDAVC